MIIFGISSLAPITNAKVTKINAFLLAFEALGNFL